MATVFKYALIIYLKYTFKLNFKLSYTYHYILYLKDGVK
jgi:hypothetical protein